MTFATNWLALMPWRRNRDKHWIEQARLVYPVLTAARSNLLIVPGIITLLVLLMWPNSSPLWLFAGVIAMLGSNIGTLFLHREVYSRVSVPDLLRESAINWLTRFLIWLIFITAAVTMPDQFSWLAWLIGIAVLSLWMLWARGGWIWLGKLTGLFGPAPDRLQQIVSETSARMNVSCQEVLLVHSSFCQAYALPDVRKVMFTKRLLEILPDSGVAAVCAHELAHLTESRLTRYSRLVRILAFLPWIFFNPLIHTFGMAGFLGLVLATFFIPRIYSNISRKLERCADSMAKTNEIDEGTYARTLARLYEDNLTPAVTARRQTHPHLYDRLVAAGVTPDFPRPKPANSMAWHGRLLAIVGGTLLGIFATYLINSFNSSN